MNLPWALGRPVALARTAYLAAGYLGLLVAGVWVLLQENPFGLLFLSAGGVGLAFLTRRGVTTAVCLLILADGLVGLRWLEALAAAVGALLALQAAGGMAGGPAAEVLDEEPGPPPRLRIRTLGRLVLQDSDGDHAGWLLARPVVSFVWLYLLARALKTPGDRVMKTALAPELNPSLKDPEQQRDKLRKRTNDFLSTGVASLVECFHQDDELVWLDLGGCDLDVLRLQALRDRCRAAGPLLSDSLSDRVERELTALGWGEFLPMWEEIEQRQTHGKGSARQLVTDVRLLADETRADLALTLADACLARNQAQRALGPLQQAIQLCPQRKDLAQRLVTAYLKTDQLQRATELRRDYQLGEV